MTRNAFFSFHYRPDNWRAAQVRNMGVVEGNRPATDNDWETIAGAGERAIKRWIDQEMHGTSVVIVLVGASTAGRPWINYEIEKAWRDGRGVLGVNVHSLEDHCGQKSLKGTCPFAPISVDGLPLSTVAKVYSPPYMSSTSVHAYIEENLSDWVESAIRTRRRHARATTSSS